MAKTISYGKYKGYRLDEIPQEYLDWLIDSHRKSLLDFEEEAARRERQQEADLSVAGQIVQAGFRALAKRIHPDAGGNADAFNELKATQEQLQELLRRAGWID